MRHRLAPKRKLTPITTRRGQRLSVWFFGWMIAGLAVSVCFMPILMAATDPERDFGPALSAYFGQSPFIALLPGVFTTVIFLGPVWLILRIWIARQGERALGSRPAVFPVWLMIWLAYAAVQVWIGGEDGADAPPGILAQIPAPFDLLFNGFLLVQMAGVTVMFAFYRRARPHDGLDRPGQDGPITRLR